MCGADHHKHCVKHCTYGAVTSYYYSLIGNTYSSFTQFIDWKYTGKLDKIFSRDFEIWILILLKIYITQKNKMAEFKMVEFKMANIIGKK